MCDRTDEISAWPMLLQPEKIRKVIDTDAAIRADRDALKEKLQQRSKIDDENRAIALRWRGEVVDLTRKLAEVSAQRDSMTTDHDGCTTYSDLQENLYGHQIENDELKLKQATLQAELEAVQKKWHYAATCDADLDMADQCIALQAELEGVRRDNDAHRTDYMQMERDRNFWFERYHSFKLRVTQVGDGRLVDMQRDLITMTQARDGLAQQLAAREGQVKGLEEHQQLHDRIFARQKFLLEEQCKTITRLEGVIAEAAARLEHSSHSKEQPEPYESRAPVIRAYLQDALKPGA